jgi:copper(I)-binding protein
MGFDDLNSDKYFLFHPNAALSWRFAMRSNTPPPIRIGNSILFHVLAIAALLVVATAGGADAAEVTVSDAWMRALPPSVPSGGYFTLHNGGGKPVTLTGAQSPACGMLMLHKSKNHGGMGMMMDVPQVNVPAGGTIRFAPGGYHLMCMDSKPLLKVGKSVPVTLSFRDGPPVTARFVVRNAAGK